MACSSLILLPALICAVTFIADLAIEARQMAEASATGEEIATALTGWAITYSLITIGVFLVCAIASMILSLKLSNGMIGPVHRLEAQVEKMLNGVYEPIPALRKGDYLKNLGESLNELAKRLGKRQA